jgi:SAM-dependent methyltransferase
MAHHVVNPRVRLFVASFLLLYFELVMIRWIPGHVRVLAYFTNFVLIACFFGMGLGLMLSRLKRDLSPFLVGGIALLVVLAIVFKWLWVGGDAIVIFLEYEGQAKNYIALAPVLAVFYMGIAVAFVPFGQVIGRAFQGDSLTDYSLNLFGSLTGIAVFSIYSFLSLPAWCWFLLGLPLLLMLVPPRFPSRIGTTVISALLVLVVWNLDRGTIWSPYHKLEIVPAKYDPKTPDYHPYNLGSDAKQLPLDVAFNLRVNDDFYQNAVDLSDEAVARYPVLRAWRDASFTVCNLHRPLDRVLIVGGGTGNDAAAALRCGAKHVDVVDIDPKIVEIGRAMHPEHPYSNPAVHVTIDDARHFFHGATPGYDAVVFAFLDSHRLLSTFSSLRLDSYVFTVESFEEARRLLSPSGVQITAFALAGFHTRFYEMLRAAYGEEPIIPGDSKIYYLSGPGAQIGTGLLVHPRPVDGAAVLATDDWPFIYAQARNIPFQYLCALAIMLGISFLAVRWIAGSSAIPDWHFFFLGAAFLLLETHNVTATALAFGSTWYVNSVVFASILAMSLLSNFLMAKFRTMEELPVVLIYGGLFAALALNWFLPVGLLAGTSFPIRFLTVGGTSALPVFFAGMIFARSFKTTTNPTYALSSNVLGSVAGGAIEYVSLITGLKFLILIMAVLYGASAVWARR